MWFIHFMLGYFYIYSGTHRINVLMLDPQANTLKLPVGMLKLVVLVQGR